MAQIECYLKELDKQRDKLANILTALGIPSDESETYNSLVAKVGTIVIGGSDVFATANVIPVANGGVVDDIFAIETREGS